MSMASIGEKLKSAREKKSLTIEQVQKQTRIHSAVLTALEEGRCRDILGPTYVKSFLKKYSGYLGLDPAELLKDYSSLTPEEPARPAISIDKIKLKDSFVLPTFSITLKRLFIFAVAITLLTFFGSRIVRSFKAPKGFSKGPVKDVASLRPKAKGPSAKTSQDLSIPAKVPLKLTLKVKGNVLVKFKKDGVSIFEKVLTKGTTESFTAESRINLYVAKAEAVELILNGKPFGPLGKGIINDIEITRSGVKIR